MIFSLQVHEPTIKPLPSFKDFLKKTLSRVKLAFVLT